MDTINGLLQYTLQNIGSKSEGYIATLICDDSTEYILYRENYLPIDDSYFEPFNNRKVAISGTIEINNKYILVESVSEKEIESPTENAE